MSKLSKEYKAYPFCGVRPEYWLQSTSEGIACFIGCKGTRCHIKPFIKSHRHKNGGSTDPIVMRMRWNRRRP